jgi:hypothetical protein
MKMSWFEHFLLSIAFLIFNLATWRVFRCDKKLRSFTGP